MTTILKRHNAQQIGAEFDHVTMLPTSIVHIELAIVITEDKLVDWLRTACSIVEETMSIANF